MNQRRNSEVEEDRALDDSNQKNRKSRGFEGKQKDHQHEQDRHDTDDNVVSFKRVSQVSLGGAVTDNINRASFIIGLCQIMHGLNEIKRGIILLRKRDGQIHQNPVILLALKLLAPVTDLLIGRGKRLLRIGIQRHIALLRLLVDEHQHIHKRNLVGRNAADNPAVLLLIRRIRRIEKLRNLIVEIQQLRKISRRKLIRQHIAAHCLCIGKALTVIHLRVGFEILDQLRFLFVISGRNHDGTEILGAEIILDQLLRLLLAVLHRRRKRGIAVHIWSLLGEHSKHNKNNTENSGKNET